MADIFAGTEKPRLYIGDEEIGGGKSRDFVGYLAPSSYGYVIPYTQSDFDTSKDFDITFCFYYGGTALTGRSARPAAFGSNSYNGYYQYPAIEIELRDGYTQGIWAGLTTDGTQWTFTKLMPCTFVVGKNYIKVSYRTASGIATYYHSTDGKTYTLIDEIDTGGVTLYNSTGVNLIFGNNANNDWFNFPADDNAHIIIEECRIVSNNVLLWGYLEE